VLDIGGRQAVGGGRGGAGGGQPPAGARGAAEQPGAPNPPGGAQNYDRAEQEIVGDIVPFVEKNYRTLTGRENRAIAGLSMGGGISINVGLKRLDTFAWVGQFSSGMFGGTGGAAASVDFEQISPGFYKDPSATNRRLRLLYFSCGEEDPRMPFQTKTAEDLRSRKIRLTVRSYPGAHEWKVWRNSLGDLATLLFQ
jgi:enterochelin esterase-like enzyme